MCCGEVLGSGYDCVIWGDARVQDVLVFVENGVGDSDCPRVHHTHFPSPVVLEGRSQHVTFFAVLRECPSALRLVVEERFHADGDKGFGAVVVLPVDVGIG